MKFNSCPKCDPIKNCFVLPNELFSLGLEAGEIAVYSYLLRCEDRKTHQCWPSYQTIGSAVGMSKKTVQKYVATLEDKQLIATEQTTVQRCDGRKQNGNLLYTILPIHEAQEHFHERQMAELERTTAIHNAKALAAKKGIKFTPPDSEQSARHTPSPRCAPRVQLLERRQTANPPPLQSTHSTPVAEACALVQSLCGGRNKKRDKGMTPQAASFRATSARSAGSYEVSQVVGMWRLFKQEIEPVASISPNPAVCKGLGDVYG